MRRSIVLSIFCAVAVAAIGVSAVSADDIHLDLDYSILTQTWELYAEVITPGSGATDGSNGLAGVVAFINDIDFGIDGDAVNMASGINAVFLPNGNPPVIDEGGSLYQILYGQDLSDRFIVVGLLGVGSRVLIADGNYSGTVPSFGVGSSGTFLGATVPAVQTGALAADAITSMVNDVTPFFLLGDMNGDGNVTEDDGPLFIQALVDRAAYDDANGSVLNPDVVGDVDGSGTFDLGDLGPFSALLGGPASASAVPEPTTLSLAVVLLLGMMIRQRRRV